MENKNTSANKDKVAIVTGSATGIGYETAIHLAKNGFRTYASMRNLLKADEITKIAKSENLPLSVIQLDVTNDISITKAIETVINESGKVDVLVNNAGYGLIGSVEDMSIEELKAQYETNVFGMFRVTKAVLPHMRKQRGGSIINISSIAGRIALPLYSAYVSTKFAIEGLSESMAYELEPFGIKVAIIEPGAIRTSFRREQTAKGSSEGSPYSIMQSPSKVIEEMLKHRLYPEEVAKTVIQAIENPKQKLRYIVGKEAEELIELRMKSSDEEIFRIVGQNIFKKEEQIFTQNRGQIAAQEQFRKKIAVDGERPDKPLDESQDKEQKMSRRNFIKLLGATGAAITLPSLIPLGRAFGISTSRNNSIDNSPINNTSSQLNTSTNQSDYFSAYHSLKLTRDEQGILVVKFHTDGGPLTFTAQDHAEFVDAFYRISQDRANKIVILTGTGGEFILGIDFSSFGNVADPSVWSQVHDEGVQILENLANIRVPVIAAIEGHANVHSEYALLANVIVAGEGATFNDLPHFANGIVPGDGIFTTWSYRAGPGRAEAFLLNPEPLTVHTVYDWGVVAEIVPNGKALARAHELASLYLKAPEVTRRDTRMHFIQPLKERIVREVGYGLSLEGASAADLVKSMQAKR